MLSLEFTKREKEKEKEKEREIRLDSTRLAVTRKGERVVHHWS